MNVQKKIIYRIQFYNQGQIYELYANYVGQSDMYSFIEVENIIFGEHAQLLVDPTEEKLKSQFAGVKRTFIPLQAIIRIDEVEKEGQNKIIENTGAPANNVSPFPFPSPNNTPNKT